MTPEEQERRRIAGIKKHWKSNPRRARRQSGRRVLWKGKWKIVG